MPNTFIQDRNAGHSESYPVTLEQYRLKKSAHNPNYKPPTTSTDARGNILSNVTYDSPAIKILLTLYKEYFKTPNDYRFSLDFRGVAKKPSDYGNSEFWKDMKDYPDLPMAYKVNNFAKLQNGYQTLDITIIENNKTAFKAIESCYTPVPISTYETKRLKSIEMALQTSATHAILIYLTADKLLKVYTSVWSWDIYRKLLLLLPDLFKWEYKASTTEDEKTCLVGMQKAMLENNIDRYYEIFASIIAMIPDPPKVAEGVKQLLKVDYTKTLSTWQANLNSIQNSIDQHYIDLATKYKNLRDWELKIWGLEAKIAEPEDETIDILDYLNKHPYITRVFPSTANPKQLQLNIAAPLENFDEDAIAILKNRANENELWYTFLTLLEDPNFKFYTKSTFVFDFTELSLNLLMSKTEISDIVKHPHFDPYGCLGQNRTQMLDALRQQNVIGLIEATMAAAKGINLYDSTVMHTFRSNLMHAPNKKTILNLQTNEWISLEEYKTIGGTPNETDPTVYAS